MRTHYMSKLFLRLNAFGLLICLLAVSTSAGERWRLVGASGAQQDDTQTVPGVYDHPDHSLWEINHYNGAVNLLTLLPWVPDSVAIGYCASNNLVYQTGGDGAYRDDRSEERRVGKECRSRWS